MGLFAFGILVLIVAGVVAISGMFVSGKDKSSDMSYRSMCFLGAFVAVIIGLLCVCGPMVKIVDAGNVGVKTSFGNVHPDELKSGIHIVLPWTSVHQMSTRTEEYTMSIAPAEGAVAGDDSIDALSMDGALMKMDTTVWYRLEPNGADMVYEKLGKNYEEKIIRPAIRTAIRESTRNHLALMSFSSERDLLQQEIEQVTINTVAYAEGGENIIIERVNLRNIALPDNVATAINEKLAADQEAQKMVFLLIQEQKKAEIRVVEAGGLADSQKIIDSSLTPSYLQWKYISVLGELVDSPNNTVVILPYDQNLTPLLQIPTEKEIITIPEPTPTEESATAPIE